MSEPAKLLPAFASPRWSVSVFCPSNPVDHIVGVLREAGIPDDQIDWDAMEAARRYYAEEIGARRGGILDSRGVLGSPPSQSPAVEA